MTKREALQSFDPAVISKGEAAEMRRQKNAMMALGYPESWAGLQAAWAVAFSWWLLKASEEEA